MYAAEVREFQPAYIERVFKNMVDLKRRIGHVPVVEEQKNRVEVERTKFAFSIGFSKMMCKFVVS